MEIFVSLGMTIRRVGWVSFVVPLVVIPLQR
nr:MAG TPA: hypothetical protein [Caudoviricetes sp.]